MAREVARELRARITAGRWPPGHRVTRAEVSAEFGVKAHPAGMALRLMCAEGLMEFRRGHWTRVLGPAQTPLVGSVSERIDRVLRHRIVEGIYPPGFRLPLDDLRGEFRACRGTLSRGMAGLRAQGAIVIARGTTAVSTTVDRIPEAELLKSYSEAARRLRPLVLGYPLGAVVPEPALAQAAGLTRDQARAACHELVAVGLLIPQNGIGAFRRNPRPDRHRPLWP
ncbi:GntR family transcriptional regulator [Streptomyces sp. NPDC020875]|uniref:GntR family transcriptional regulator n=1 Tax=Streptomyces sp. NPDC020875 TaxID=3154898 RepID=UPI00340151BE